ncbi:MAG: GAF domain-containing protein [Bacteroidetes bacterium]|nr:MAG: GAF domain-containing protein [Bacteroidota bacterium]
MDVSALYRYVLFMLWLALPAHCVWAQLPEFHAQVFGAEHGLDAGDISIVFKDRQQFLWVVSDATIQRFDGRNVYKHTFESPVRQALCDRDNRIWALSGQRIWRARTDQWGFSVIPLDTSAFGQPAIIFQLPERPFCVLTTQGFLNWNERTQQFERLDLPFPPARSVLVNRRFDSSGSTLFYPGKECYIAADLATGQMRTAPTPTRCASFCAFTPDRAVISYFDGNSAWLDFSTGTTTPMDAREYDLSERQHRLNLMDAEPLGDSLFLVTTRFGACTYDLRRDRFVRHRIFAGGKPIGLEDALIRIFQDGDGTFWAHNTSSVVAFRSVRNSIGLLRNYADGPAQSWSNRVIGLAEDRAGNIWFGGFNGFNRLNRQNGQVETHPPVDDAADRLSHISVRGLAYDGRYIILGPTDKGMWLYEPETDCFFRPAYANDSVRQMIGREFIHGIFPLQDGNFLVCGRYNAYLLRKLTYRLEFLHFPGEHSGITAASQDAAGRIWLCHFKGVSVLDRQYKPLFYLDSGGGRVLSVFQQSGDTVLFGTEEGLWRFSPATAGGRWSKVKGPLAGVSVMAIHRDSLHRYWFGTDDGLYLMDSRLEVFRHFDYTDNIQGELYNLFALLQARDGLLFLGGMNGINYFYPENIDLQARPLAVTLQTLKIGDGDSLIWNPGRQLEFAPGHNTLTFEVVAPYYNNAGKLQYRYRFKEAGPWIGTGGSPVIRLADLAPGQYKLEVEARVAGLQWYPAPALEFRVRPAFWQHPAFLTGMALFLLLLLYVIVRYRENALRRRQQQSLELEKLKTTTLQYELEIEQVINYFNRSIAQTATVEEALWDIAQQCIARLDLEDCVIYLRDPERPVLLQVAALGDKSSPDQQIVAPIEIPVGQGIVGSVAQTGKPELVADTALDARYIPDDAMRRSELSVPILDGENVIGVIDTEHSKPNFYTSWHLHLFTAIASLCSNKIALARSEEARREALLETVNSERKAAEAKLQSLRLQMNPHFLFNALNSIQELILTGNSDGAALYLSKFSQLLRMVLTHSEQDLLSLREEIGILQLYVELEALRFYDTFEFKLETESGLDQDEYKLPTLLIQPFVENAIWHGLLHKEGKRRLLVRFETDARENLICIIEDNGIGREAAQKVRHTGLHTGKGLTSSAERLQVLNNRYHQQNALEIIDLIAEDGSAAGTRVRITLT